MLLCNSLNLQLPFVVEEQVVIIYAGVKGYLDKVPSKQVVAFEQSLIGKIRSKHKNILDSIRTEQKITDDTEKKLKEVLADFAAGFAA